MSQQHVLASLLTVVVVAACGGRSGGHDDGSVSIGDMWLRTEGNHILLPNGAHFRGRGANLPDTRGCGACLWEQPSASEVTRRIDYLVDDWHANFIRLLMDRANVVNGEGGVIHGGTNAKNDPAYLADLQTIVRHARARGVYVVLSLWNDPAISAMGWPTEETKSVWKALAAAFADDDNVIFGLVNEPQSNYDGQLDDEVWTAMNDHVAAIREIETGLGKPHHIIAVQGTGGWARYLTYYITHPITAGGGVNIAYETHAYDHEADFDDRFEIPSQTLPVIIGEFGPADGYMTDADTQALVTSAESRDIPYLAWAFHQRCPPNLISEQPGAGGCGVGSKLDPTPWGVAFSHRLASPWGTAP